jgi:Ca2+-binding RTX toxin-like protein
MRTTRLALLAAIGLATASAPAAAQPCTQPTPGVAQINTNGLTVTIHVTGGGVPKVNGVSCGFVATSIDVIGLVTDDNVTLNYVPPTMPVRLELGNIGTNLITLMATTGDDTIVCGATSVDRDGDSIADLDLSLSTVTLLTINGRAGDDVMDCSAAGYRVSLVGGVGDDTLDGGAFPDTINGGLDADVLTGGDGNDSFVVAANDGHDTVTGGGGIDTISYATRTATVIVGGVSAEDAISDDTEIIRGGKGNDIIDFSAGFLPHDLYGGAGSDTLIGGAGADRLYGQAANDSLRGNGGIDLLHCGPGTDAYVADAEDSYVGCENASAVRIIGDEDWSSEDLEPDDELELELDPELDPEATGGCSTAGGSSGPTTILMIGLALLGCSRRRRDSSRR